MPVLFCFQRLLSLHCLFQFVHSPCYDILCSQILAVCNHLIPKLLELSVIVRVNHLPACFYYYITDRVNRQLGGIVRLRAEIDNALQITMKHIFIL